MSIAPFASPGATSSPGGYSGGAHEEKADIRPGGPKGAPFSGDQQAPGVMSAQPGGPQLRELQVLRLQPGDRLMVHVGSEVGISGGGAGELAKKVIAALKLDELGFGVPVVVVAPGLRVEVLRPT